MHEEEQIRFFRLLCRFKGFVSEHLSLNIYRLITDSVSTVESRAELCFRANGKVSKIWIGHPRHGLPNSNLSHTSKPDSSIKLHSCSPRKRCHGAAGNTAASCRTGAPSPRRQNDSVPLANTTRVQESWRPAGIAAVHAGFWWWHVCIY